MEISLEEAPERALEVPGPAPTPAPTLPSTEHAAPLYPACVGPPPTSHVRPMDGATADPSLEMPVTEAPEPSDKHRSTSEPSAEVAKAPEPSDKHHMPSHELPCAGEVHGTSRAPRINYSCALYHYCYQF